MSQAGRKVLRSLEGWWGLLLALVTDFQLFITFL